MEFEMLHAAWSALKHMSDPWLLLMLSCGVVMGLVLGILPGIGGLSGTALLLPFTFTMDPYSAFALLLGLASTTSTGDPIRPHRNTSPPIRATSSPSTYSRVTPYLKARGPPALVAALPPIEHISSDAGSGG